jgi:magnesium-transporting ATPase (P-type)
MPPGWFPMDNYIFLGLVSEFDPPKNSAKKALMELKKAGMKVILVTGDDLKLTTDLVREMGIVKEQPLLRKKIWDLEAVKAAKAIILDGHDLSRLSIKENKDEILKTWLEVKDIVICRA